MNVSFLFLFPVLLFNLTGIVAQQDNVDIPMEINEQVWQVFKTSYEARDSEKFRSIHLKDVLRVNESGVRLGYEYHQEIASWRPLPGGISMHIDFAFESRQYRDTVGYEVGYYRVISERKSMESDSFYGRFHVVLKKVGDHWKIAQDYDTGSVGDVRIGREFFEKAQFLELR